MTAKRRVSATSVYFESMPYRLDEATGGWAPRGARGAGLGGPGSCNGKGRPRACATPSGHPTRTRHHPPTPTLTPTPPAGLVDYDTLEKTAALFRPKLIIAGARRHAARAGRSWQLDRPTCGWTPRCHAFALPPVLPG